MPVSKKYEWAHDSHDSYRGMHVIGKTSEIVLGKYLLE